jgi:hypothetical protein
LGQYVLDCDKRADEVIFLGVNAFTIALYETPADLAEREFKKFPGKISMLLPQITDFTRVSGLLFTAD